MKRFLLLLLFVLPSALMALPYSAESNRCLQSLDSVVLLRETINLQKQENINHLKELRQFLSSDEDIYKHNQRLYDECFTFDSEMAMEIADENLAIAKRSKNQDGIYEWSIKRSFILSSTGQLMEAAEVLKEFPTGQVSHSLQLAYYGQMQYLYSHLQQYSWQKSIKEEYQETGSLYNDSIYAILLPDDPDYSWYVAWTDMYSPRLKESAEKLRTIVDTLSLNTRSDAMLAYAVAKMYEQMEQRDLYLQYMSKSAIADLRAANQDIASLEELAQVLYSISTENSDKDNSVFSTYNPSVDLQRAYAYINVCLETSKIYNNLVRTVSVARVMDNILKSYQNRDEIQRRRLLYSLIAMFVLLLLITAAAILVWRQKTRLSTQKAKLRESNQQINKHKSALAEANDALKEVNKNLTEANSLLTSQNAIKEEYIGFVFAICSNYISKLDEYRKDINRKAKVKQWNEILAITEKQTILGDEIKEFYQNFDTIFLHVYPTYIEEFNSLLLPEEQISPKNGELLNTDLRIYALVRLGITDSTKIADFLHISAQTVYNNRMKIRNKAINKELFTEKIKHLCTSR